MKKILVLSILIISASETPAQSTKMLGIKGAFSWTNLSYYGGLADDASHNTSPGHCFSFGITYDYRDDIYYGLELLYEQRSYSEISTTSYPGTSTTYYNSGDYAYYAMPIKLGYGFGNTTLLFGNIGFSPALLVKAIDKLSYTDNNGNVRFLETDLNKSNNVFELSGLLEVGCECKIKSNFIGVATVRIQDSFTGIDKYAHQHWWETNISLGVKYVLHSALKKESEK